MYNVSQIVLVSLSIFMFFLTGCQSSNYQSLEDSNNTNSEKSITLQWPTSATVLSQGDEIVVRGILDGSDFNLSSLVCKATVLDESSGEYYTTKNSWISNASDTSIYHECNVTADTNQLLSNSSHATQSVTATSNQLLFSLPYTPEREGEHQLTVTVTDYNATSLTTTLTMHIVKKDSNSLWYQNITETCPNHFYASNPPTTQWVQDNIGIDYEMNSTNQRMCRKGLCFEQICAFGQMYDSTTQKCLDLACSGCKGKCIRGFCISNTKTCTGTKPNGYVCVNGTYLKRPKIAMWHGGIIGLAESNETVYKSYLDDIIAFVADKKIDVFMLNLSMWQPTKNQYMYYKDRGFLVNNFLKKLPAGTAAGVTGVINPENSGWCLDDSNESNSTFCSNKTYRLSGGFTTAGSGSHTYTDCNMTVNTQGCPLDCFSHGTCPPGCPNIYANFIQYVAEVNKLAEANNTKKITYLVADGESAHVDVGAFCQLGKLNAQLDAGLEFFGYAKALTAGIAGNTGGSSYAVVNNMVLPENYWYVNTIYPWSGYIPNDLNYTQYTYSSSASSYRVFADEAEGFYTYMQQSDTCGGVPYSKSGKSYPALTKNIENNSSTMWPMFSFENISTTPPVDNCIQLNYYGDVNTSLGSICGTFDGFSYWSWEEFEKFLTLFAYKYNIEQVGIYSAEFIPPQWMPGGKFSTNQYKATRATGSGGSSCTQNSCQDCAPSCSSDADCIAWLNNSSHCDHNASFYPGTYCRTDKGVCHIGQ